LAAAIVVTPCSRNSGGSRCCKVPNTRSMRPRASGLAAREIGDARHVRESDNAAVVETDALLACSL
jgi:hypothetical protein